MASPGTNTLLTIDMITRLAVKIFKNTNAFVMGIDTQYDSQFAVEGAKIGDALRIRLPNDYTVRTGAGASVQNTAEQFTSLPLQTQVGVDTAFSSAERALKLDDYAERIMLPKMNNLVGSIAADVMNGSEGGVCNMAANFSAGVGSALLAPTQFTVTDAEATLDINSAPTMQRKLVNGPRTDAKLAALLTGLLNPVTEISRQYRTGSVKNALGFDWLRDQTVIQHTVGSFTSGTVNGANQTSSGLGGITLTVNAITGTLNAGDIVTIAGVNGVNRVTKATTGELRQFVVTAAAANGATQVSLYPGIVPAVGGNSQQYQTVVNTAANGAAISLYTLPGITFRKSIAFTPQMVTLATADLRIPRNLQESSREVYDGISIRNLTQYAIGTDEEINRLDVIYGYKYIKPEWGVIVADII